MIRRLFYVLEFKIVMKLRVFGCYLAAVYLHVPVSASKLAAQAEQEALELAQDKESYVNAFKDRQQNYKLAGKCEELIPERTDDYYSSRPIETDSMYEDSWKNCFLKGTPIPNGPVPPRYAHLKKEHEAKRAKTDKPPEPPAPPIV